MKVESILMPTDLIVIDGHGPGGGRRFLRGSVAERANRA